MSKMIRLLLSFSLLALAAAATAQTCCEIKRDLGQTAYNKGNYATAITKWKEGKNDCSEASCADFNALISKAQKKQAAATRAKALRQQQEREAEAALIVQEKQAEAARFERQQQERKADAARFEREKQADADDSFWEALKDGDVADCDKYLGKYPDGRHAGDAERRKKLLAPASETPTSTAPNTEKIPDNMVRVRGGTFTMGDMFAEGGSDELPTHSVTVDEFLMGKTEVTFDEFDAFCTATGREKPSDAGWGRGTRPVINVDWYDAVEYCNWLSQRQGLNVAYTIDKSREDPNNSGTYDSKKWTVSTNWNANGYRLPTEAEWEYAAREAGKKIRFGNGKDIADPAQINFDGSASNYSVVGEFRGETVPVGEIAGAANNLGLRHMSGNVWEWCNDWYDGYNSSPSKDPKGADSGGVRVLRGGSWYYYPGYVRCAVRVRSDPGGRGAFVGFRVARGY